jgi:hypothetical protein
MNYISDNTFKCPHILGDDSDFINPETWAVSAVRKQDSKNPLHVFLVIQGMNESGQNLLYKAHLTINDNSGSGHQSTSLQNKKAKIILDSYSEALEKEPTKIDAYFKNCVHRTAWITAKKGLELLKIIKEDIKNDNIYYTLVDNKVKNMSVNIGISSNSKNCASWAEWVLERADIKLIHSGWLGVIIAVHSKILLPDDSQSSPAPSCSIL